MTKKNSPLRLKIRQLIKEEKAALLKEQERAAKEARLKNIIQKLVIQEAKKMGIKINKPLKEGAINGGKAVQGIGTPKQDDKLLGAKSNIGNSQANASFFKGKPSKKNVSIQGKKAEAIEGSGSGKSMVKEKTNPKFYKVKQEGKKNSTSGLRQPK